MTFNFLKKNIYSINFMFKYKRIIIFCFIILSVLWLFFQIPEVKIYLGREVRIYRGIVLGDLDFRKDSI